MIDVLRYIEKMKEMYEGPRITAQEPRTLLAEYKPGDDKMEQTEVLRPKRIDIFGNVIPAETLETWEPNPFLKPHAEGGRIGYDDGQLVRNTVDGSRPGYQGPTKGHKQEKIKFLNWLENNKDFDFANSSTTEIMKKSKTKFLL